MYTKLELEKVELLITYKFFENCLFCASAPHDKNTHFILKNSVLSISLVFSIVLLAIFLRTTHFKAQHKIRLCIQQNDYKLKVTSYFEILIDVFFFSRSL